LPKHVRVEFQTYQVLSQAVMQFTRNSATLRILQAEQASGELSQCGRALLHLKFKISLRAAQFLFDLFALCHFGLKRLRLLLQVGDAAKAFLFAEQRPIAFDRYDLGMLGADLQE
jgi:hypothetical protein